MPVRQTGNWAPTPPDAVLIDYLDVSDGWNGGGPLWVGRAGGRNVTWLSPWNDGISFAWVQGIAPFAGLQVRRGTVTNAAHGTLWSVPRWPFGSARSAVTLGEPIPSVRYRFDSIIQLVDNGGIPDGAAVGYAGGGASSFLVGASNTGVNADVDGAGVYRNLIRKPAKLPGIVVLGGVPGAINALLPHTFSLELISGPVNRVRMWLAGALIFEESSAGPLLPLNEFANGGAGPQISRPATAAGINGYWMYHAGRLRIDYV